MNIGYEARFIADHLRIELIGQRIEGQYRVVSLTINGVNSGSMQFAPQYGPALSKGDTGIAIWGGFALYIYEFATLRLTLLAQDDEIHAVYELGNHWLLIRELSLVVISVPSGNEVSRYDHDEILVNSQWEDDKLLITDLEGRKLVFLIAEDSLQLHKAI